MRVSVVIPTYNSGPLVVEAVESVLGQTRPAEEVLVIDDGSTDDTAERLARFGNRLRYIRKENGGVSSARNRGIEEATGDWIAFLDADDVWHPRKLELQAATLTRRPDIGLLGALFFDWPEEQRDREVDLNGAIDEISFEELLFWNILGTSSVIVRAEILRAAGPFDLALRGPEDYDMWLRVAQRTQVARLRTRLSGYRYLPNSLSRNAARMEAGLIAILGKLEAGVFRHRPMLRRKVWARYRFTCGLTYRETGQLGIAANRFARSLIGWPFGISKGNHRIGGLARFKSLMSTLWQMAARRQSEKPIAGPA